MENNARLKKRCTWVNENNPQEVAYHDKEWGRPVKCDQKHFELLLLEGAQAGLSWSTILAKRQNYRQAFAGFEPEKVARFTPLKINQLMNNDGIVRHQLKITSAVNNAKCFLQVQKEFGSFNAYIWAFVKKIPIKNHYTQQAAVPAKTPLSEKIAKDLKKRGFTFVGPTIIYSYLQAIGIVDDHLESCFIRQRQIQPWTVYMIQCADNSLYTGIALDVEKRFQAHQSNSPQGAKYLRGRGPLKIVFTQKVANKSKALQVEREIKAMTKKQKIALIANQN